MISSTVTTYSVWIKIALQLFITLF